MNWYINQEVVCVHAGNNTELIEGNIYTIRALSMSICKCAGVSIDVGHKIDEMFEIQCSDCHHVTTASDANGIMWYGEDQFRPLDELADISELNQVLEKEIFT